MMRDIGQWRLFSRREPNLYRGILEMVSRFGFISREEVEYGWNLTVQQAKDRLKYLTKAGLLDRFESGTTPPAFYCLTPFGRRMAAAHRLSDEIEIFRPWHYNPLTQRHDRMLARLFLALRTIFGRGLQGWMSERTLRRSGGEAPAQGPGSGPRLMDGLFRLEIEKQRATEAPHITRELWWCGLELELTLKSAERYRKQFRDLAATVYDGLGGIQKIPLVLFLTGTGAIERALRKHWAAHRDRFGRCLFVFGSADQLLHEKGAAPLVRCLGNDERTIRAAEMNRVRVRPAVSAAAEASGKVSVWR